MRLLAVFAFVASFVRVRQCEMPHRSKNCFSNLACSEPGRPIATGRQRRAIRMSALRRRARGWCSKITISAPTSRSTAIACCRPNGCRRPAFGRCDIPARYRGRGAAEARFLRARQHATHDVQSDRWWGSARQGWHRARARQQDAAVAEVRVRGQRSATDLLRAAGSTRPAIPRWRIRPSPG